MKHVQFVVFRPSLDSCIGKITMGVESRNYAFKKCGLDSTHESNITS